MWYTHRHILFFLLYVLYGEVPHHHWKSMYKHRQQIYFRHGFGFLYLYYYFFAALCCTIWELKNGNAKDGKKCLKLHHWVGWKVLEVLGFFDGCLRLRKNEVTINAKENKGNNNEVWGRLTVKKYVLYSMEKKGGDGTLINTQQPSLRGWFKGKK